MEFWGVEVKAGETLKVQPEFGKLIHISQAALGEVKDVIGAKYVPLRLKIDDKKFVIGSLSAQDRTQLMFDLVFEKDFEISHDWKNGSVFFIGYTADEPVSDEEFSSDDFDSEDEPVDIKENGIIKPKSGNVKAVKGVLACAKALADKKKEVEPDSDDEVDSGSDSDEEGDLPVGSSDVSGDDSEEDDLASSDEEEVLKAKPSKKRPAQLEQNTPASKKAKAKAATPEKSGKKGQNATPVPSKSAGKDKSKEQSPKSGSQLSCKSCTKTFTSGNALQAHSKAKHGAK